MRKELSKGHIVLISIVAFAFGAIVSYLFCQYHYLDIDTEFKVVDTIMSGAAIAIGLYIAFILENRRNKSQNLYGYLVPKFDLLWREFMTFSGVLAYGDKIEVKEVSKKVKSFSQNLDPLIEIFRSFEFDVECLKDIEKKIEALENQLTDSKDIRDQVIHYATTKGQIVKQLNDINKSFAATLKIINDMPK